MMNDGNEKRKSSANSAARKSGAGSPWRASASPSSNPRKSASGRGLRKSTLNTGFRGSLVTTVKASGGQDLDAGQAAAKPRQSVTGQRRKSSRRASFKKSYVRYVRKSKKSFTRVSISRRTSFPRRKSSVRRRKSDPGSSSRKRKSSKEEEAPVVVHKQPPLNSGFKGSLRLSVGLLPPAYAGRKSTLNSPKEPGSPPAPPPLSARGSVVTITGERVIVSRDGRRESLLNQGFRGSVCGRRFADRHGSFTLVDYMEPPPPPPPDIEGVGVFLPVSRMTIIIPEPPEPSPDPESSHASPRHPGTEGYLKNAGFRQASVGSNRPLVPERKEGLAVTGFAGPYASRDLAVPHFRGSLTKTGRRESVNIHPRL